MDSLKVMAERYGVDSSNFDSQDLACALPLILKIRGEGSTFFIKADGERDVNISTIMINGGLLGDDYIRCETDDILKGVNQVIAEYSEKFWN